MEQKRLLFIGAHPDDADILCGGTAIKLAAAGHVVKFVSATNGDTGHQTLSRKETAIRRKAETQASAKLAGLLEYEVLNHDCGLEPSVENRREMVRVIRKFKPDMVISHRLCDYHPDHRATSQLVLDCAYVCMVPHFCEDTPIPEKIPVFAYSFDAFLEPRPLRPDAVVEFDSILDRKLALFNCHTSQFYEWLPWTDGIKDFDVTKLNEEQKKEHLKKWVRRFMLACQRPEVRAQLKRAYGEEKGSRIVYAEVFEQSTYSRQLSPEDFQKFFDFSEMCKNE